jgi:hypothetical protein
MKIYHIYLNQKAIDRIYGIEQEEVKASDRPHLVIETSTFKRICLPVRTLY